MRITFLNRTFCVPNRSESWFFCDISFISMMEKAKRFWKLVKYSSRKVHLFQNFFWQMRVLETKYAIDKLVMLATDIKSPILLVTVMLVTTLCWWFYPVINKQVTNILNLSPTHFVSNIRRQHRCHHIIQKSTT